LIEEVDGLYKVVLALLIDLELELARGQEVLQDDQGIGAQLLIAN